MYMNYFLPIHIVQYFDEATFVLRICIRDHCILFCVLLTGESQVAFTYALRRRASHANLHLCFETPSHMTLREMCLLNSPNLYEYSKNMSCTYDNIPDRDRKY